MKIFKCFIGLFLLIGILSCEKENNGVVYKLKDGSYMGSFSYDNNLLWESFIIKKDSFIELASGGVMNQKYPAYCLTEGIYKIIEDSIYFKRIAIAQPPNGIITDCKNEYLLMGSYYIEERSNASILFSRVAKNVKQIYKLKLHVEL